MDTAAIANLHKRLEIYEKRLEDVINEYKQYAYEEITSMKQYELEEAKLALKYKTEGNPYKIQKPTQDDLERMMKLELTDLYFAVTISKKQKEVSLSKYKIISTQISTIQSRLKFVSDEMKLV